ncbi:cation diffusion facilitator family transporter [Oscillospiraceae bacterium MB08-C2-2]|nr:cation diffusion facilitator family transporter [Oscillospiraceae bacterium MB08-C2-2]
MTDFLIRLLVKNPSQTENPAVREGYARLAGVVGIVSNLLLFAAKMVIGTLAGSIAITADAVNNLSDCGSSVITLVGFRLSRMPADEEHPYGHARIEYLSGLAVAMIVMVIGLDFLKSSFQKILAPQPVAFSWVTAGVLALSILIKLWQGRFNRQVGRRIGSTALIATAADSMNDVYTTLAVLVSALVAYFTGLELDGYVGAAVALFILWSGVGLIRQTLDPLLGMAPDHKLVQSIEGKILSYPSVLGVHDLVVHNYGPTQSYASAHVEMPASQDILISHDIVDSIERDVACELAIDLVIHMDPIVVDDPETNQMREKLREIVARVDSALSMHDFRMVKGTSHSNLIFDITVPPKYKMTNNQLRQKISQEVRELGGQYFCVITLDRSYTISTQRDEE